MPPPPPPPPPRKGGAKAMIKALSTRIGPTSPTAAAPAPAARPAAAAPAPSKAAAAASVTSPIASVDTKRPLAAAPKSSAAAEEALTLAPTKGTPAAAAALVPVPAQNEVTAVAGPSPAAACTGTSSSIASAAQDKKTAPLLPTAVAKPLPPLSANNNNGNGNGNGKKKASRQQQPSRPPRFQRGESITSAVLRQSPKFHADRPLSAAAEVRARQYLKALQAAAGTLAMRRARAVASGVLSSFGSVDSRAGGPTSSKNGSGNSNNCGVDVFAALAARVAAEDRLAVSKVTSAASSSVRLRSVGAGLKRPHVDEEGAADAEASGTAGGLVEMERVDDGAIVGEATSLSASQKARRRRSAAATAKRNETRLEKLAARAA